MNIHFPPFICQQRTFEREREQKVYDIYVNCQISNFTILNIQQRRCIFNKIVVFNAHFCKTKFQESDTVNGCSILLTERCFLCDELWFSENFTTTLW